MEIKKEIVVKEIAQIELLTAYEYYVKNYSLTYAERFRTGFYEQLTTINPNPYIYPECRYLPTKSQMYRNIIWGNYLIIYKIRKQNIEVLSLFHAKLKPTKIRLIRKVK